MPSNTSTAIAGNRIPATPPSRPSWSSTSDGSVRLEREAPGQESERAAAPGHEPPVSPRETAPGQLGTSGATDLFPAAPGQESGGGGVSGELSATGGFSHVTRRFLGRRYVVRTARGP